MATLVYNSLGFYKIPITKTLLSSLMLSCGALHVPIVANYRHLMVCSVNDILFRHQLWRLMVSKMVFADMKDMVCGCLLLYYLRVFERRFGSNKYSSYLLACFTISSLLEVSLVWALNALNVTDIEYLTPGPFNIIFALFVNYYFDVPALHSTPFLGIPINAKSLTYLLGLQAMISTNSSIVCAVSGLVTGFICRWNVFHVCDIIKVPKCVASVVSKVLGGLLCSGPPAESPIQMGATFEIQRQQQIELAEQQMLFSRFAEMNPRNDSNVFPNRRQNDLSAQSSSASTNSEASGSTNAEHVTTLVEMGFSRQNVVRALQRSNNDMNLATNILLSES